MFHAISFEEIDGSCDPYLAGGGTTFMTNEAAVSVGPNGLSPPR
jgi:hypothetical protein